MTSDLQKARKEAAKKETELKEALEQIGMITREKGVAMRDNAVSYEQSIQKETQVPSVTHTLTSPHTYTHTLTHSISHTHSHPHPRLPPPPPYTQLRELQAEKQILEQQRDIANKERERVINDLVGLKKKLETIKSQRQKDAKDLSVMRHLKDKAVQVCVCRGGVYFL